MIVTIYTDSTNLVTEEFINEHGNLLEVEVDRFSLFDYFKDEIMNEFHIYQDKERDEFELFQEWLNEYTADDTDDLWEWCERYGIECRIDRIAEEFV